MMNDRQGISKLGFIFILGFLSGCRLPPAQIDADSSEKSALSRREIHRRQVIRDSAAQIAFHPLAAAKLLLLIGVRLRFTFIRPDRKHLPHCTKSSLRQASALTW